MTQDLEFLIKGLGFSINGNKCSALFQITSPQPIFSVGIIAVYATTLLEIPDLRQSAGHSFGLIFLASFFASPPERLFSRARKAKNEVGL